MNENKINKREKINFFIFLLLNIYLIVYLFLVAKSSPCKDNFFQKIISIFQDNLTILTFFIGIQILFLIFLFIKKRKKIFYFWLFVVFLIGFIFRLHIAYMDAGRQDFNDAKPAIYIYPTKTTDISVKLKIKGRITKVIPDYNGEWKVRVKPNGQMKVIGGNSQITYDYLFYENSVNKIDEPKEGWVIKNNEKELTKFYNSILYKIGFNENEANEFIDYWVPKLTKDIDNNFILVKQFSREYLDANMEIIIEPKPDKMLRVEFLYEGIDNKMEIINPKLKEFKREGYFSVEWGGIIK